MPGLSEYDTLSQLMEALREQMPGKKMLVYPARPKGYMLDINGHKLMCGSYLEAKRFLDGMLLGIFFKGRG